MTSKARDLGSQVELAPLTKLEAGILPSMGSGLWFFWAASAVVMLCFLGFAKVWTTPKAVGFCDWSILPTFP